MPVDRGPSASSDETRPKVRKLNRSNNQLKRNSACIPCRRRRIKCDAGKPHCSSCIRSFHFLERTQPDKERDEAGVQCWYDEEGDGHEEEEPLPKGRKRSAVSNGVVHIEEEEADAQEAIRKLEARVAELQAALVASGPNDSPGAAFDPAYAPAPGTLGSNVSPWSNMSFPPQSSSAMSATIDPNNPFPNVGQGSALPSQTTSLPASARNDVNVNPLQNIYDNSQGNFLGTIPDLAPPRKAPVVMDTVVDRQDPDLPNNGVDGEAANLGLPFLQMIWPGWPPHLPTPAIVDHMVNTFFNVVPSVPRLLHKQRFLARLSLPPTHPDFPHVALIHAICAVSARYTAVVRTCSVAEMIERVDQQSMHGAKFGLGTADDYNSIARDPCFGERHARYAMSESDPIKNVGRKMVEALQARALMITYCQQNTRWIEGWMTIGAVCRAVVPLGLALDSVEVEHHLKGPIRFMRSIIPPPTEDWDREERTALMSYVVAMDTIASSTAGWSTSLALEEVAARLPCSAADFEKSDNMPTNPQTMHSADLFTNHPVKDSFVMMIKGIILLNRVNKYVRMIKLLPEEDRGAQIGTQAFRALESDIGNLSLTFPPNLRDPLQARHGKGIDADIMSALLFAHTATIHLHEPFAILDDPTDLSATRLLGAARACLSLVYQISTSRLDLSFMLVPITVAHFFTAARTLLLFFEQALTIGDQYTVNMLAAEIDVFKNALAVFGHRFAMGARHCGMLENQIIQIHRENNRPYNSSAQDWPWIKAVRKGITAGAVIGPPGHITGLSASVSASLRPDLDRRPGDPTSKNDHITTSLGHVPGNLPYHPDGMLCKFARDNKVTWKDTMDVRRGYVGRSGSRSSSGPSPAGAAGLGGSSHSPATPKSTGSGGGGVQPMPQNAQSMPFIPNLGADNGIFDFGNGLNADALLGFGQTGGTMGIGQWTNVGFAAPQQADINGAGLGANSLQGGQGVGAEDVMAWLNWTSTANITMFSPEELNGVNGAAGGGSGGATSGNGSAVQSV